MSQKVSVLSQQCLFYLANVFAHYCNKCPVTVSLSAMFLHLCLNVFAHSCSKCPRKCIFSFNNVFASLANVLAHSCNNKCPRKYISLSFSNVFASLANVFAHSCSKWFKSISSCLSAMFLHLDPNSFAHSCNKYPRKYLSSSFSYVFASLPNVFAHPCSNKLGYKTEKTKGKTVVQHGTQSLGREGRVIHH